MLDRFGSWASILGLLIAVPSFAILLLRWWAQKKVRVGTIVERGPMSLEHGIVESAVRITLANESKQSIEIKDIRLIFCGKYGASVAPEAPKGRSHPELPTQLDSGSEISWYIPGEKLSDMLRSLHAPTTVPLSSRTVKLHVRCTGATGRVYKGSSFLFSLKPSEYSPFQLS